MVPLFRRPCNIEYWLGSIAGFHVFIYVYSTIATRSLCALLCPQVEKQLMSQQGQGHAAAAATEDDPLAALLSESGLLDPGVAGQSSPVPMDMHTQTLASTSAEAFQPATTTAIAHPPLQAPPNTGAGSAMAPSYMAMPGGAIYSHGDASGVVLTTPAQTTFEENAVRAQQILQEYTQLNAVPRHRKDFNYDFPSGLFSSEVDLEGSQTAYHNIVKVRGNGWASSYSLSTISCLLPIYS